MTEASKQQKQLSKLSQSVVETTIYGTVDAAGQKRLQDVIQKTAEREFVEEQKRQEYEAQLKRVKVDAADVSVLQTQFAFSKAVADRKLRECGGDLRKALESLMGLSS